MSFMTKKDMLSEIDIGDLRPEEVDEANRLVSTCFDRHVRHTCTPEGTDELHRAVHLMLYEAPENHFTLVAREEDRVVGLITVRDACHICLLFVDAGRLGQGIGRALFESAVARCLEEEPGLKLMDVHSSLYAVEFYDKLGFERIGEKRTQNGICYHEMRLTLWRHPQLISDTP